MSVKNQVVSKNKGSPIEAEDKVLLGLTDEGEAVKVKGEMSGAAFDASADGVALFSERQNAEALRAEEKQAKGQMQRAEKELNGTHQYIKTAPETEGVPAYQVLNFSKWRRPDQVMLVVLALALVTALALGVGNVYANLMAAQIETFEDNPWLALGLSFILPIAALALKTVTHFIELDEHRRTYALYVYALTIALLFTWAVLFAQSFAGVSGGMDFSLEDDGSSGTPLVLVQLLLELFCGAALALALEDIYLKYSPETHRENPHYKKAEKAFEIARAHHKSIAEKRRKSLANIARLEAKRAQYIHQQTAIFLSHYRKFHSL